MTTQEVSNSLSPPPLWAGGGTIDGTGMRGSQLSATTWTCFVFGSRSTYVLRRSRVSFEYYSRPGGEMQNTEPGKQLPRTGLTEP